MQTLTLLAMITQATGLSDLQNTSSILTHQMALDTFVGGGQCHVYIAWRIHRGEPTTQFSTWEAGGNYRAQSISCPPGTAGAWDEDPELLGCVNDTRLNAYQLVPSTSEAEDRWGSGLYRFSGTMVLSVSSSVHRRSDEKTQLGTLACVSSTCACSFLPNI
jgi:hypothetical protein